LSQTSFLVLLASLFASFILITPNAIPAPRIGLQTSQTPAVSPVTLQAALATLSPNVAISDVTLTGTVHRIAGSDDESGTATLKALPSGAARCDLYLPSGTLSEIYSFSGSGPAGAWSGADGTVHAVPSHNLLSEPGWFFPTFVISRRLAAGFVVTDIGAEVRNGQKVEHFSMYQNPTFPFPNRGVTFQHLTQIDFFIDPQTFLPIALSYNVHPDSNEGQDIPVEIEFADYRSVSGAKIPFHIQKFLNGTLLLDIQLQNGAINSGISASAFTIQ
jgi:hypothetical protein